MQSSNPAWGETQFMCFFWLHLTGGCIYKECTKSLCINSTIVAFALNMFHFISHEKGLGRVKMLCHSPVPHHGYTHMY